MPNVLLIMEKSDQLALSVGLKLTLQNDGNTLDPFGFETWDLLDSKPGTYYWNNQTKLNVLVGSNYSDELGTN